CVLFLISPPRSAPFFPYTTLFRSRRPSRRRLRSRHHPSAVLPVPRIPVRDPRGAAQARAARGGGVADRSGTENRAQQRPGSLPRSEEHTSELQSLAYLVCRLLLEK